MQAKSNRHDITHERIVDVASRALRRHGLGGVGVADVMKQAGLTHGGFYAHFPSREALLAAAIERAGRDSALRMDERMKQGQSQGRSAFRALVEAYLSDNHLTGVENGCVVAALSSDIPRQPTTLLEPSIARVNGLVSMVQRSLPDGQPPEQAMVIASTLVGALQLARALGANQQGKDLLAAVRSMLLLQHDTHNTD